MQILNQISNSSPVVTFRLPKAGEKDPHFGLNRSFYYEAEAQGRLRMVRLKKSGVSRGLTLIPYQAVIDLLVKENPGLLSHLEITESASTHAA